MKLCRISGELHVLGKNEAVQMLLQKHREIERWQRVCDSPRHSQALDRAKEFVRGKLAEFGVPLEV